MDHPFFDTIAFPWDHPLAIKLHKALHQAITNPSNIENRCQKCLGSIQLNKSATPDEVWQEALNKLTTARQLQKLCEDLLDDPGVASIHSTVQLILQARSKEGGETRGDVGNQAATSQANSVEDATLIQADDETRRSLIQYAVQVIENDKHCVSAIYSKFEPDARQASSVHAADLLFPIKLEQEAKDDEVSRTFEAYVQFAFTCKQIMNVAKPTLISLRDIAICLSLPRKHRFDALRQNLQRYAIKQLPTQDLSLAKLIVSRSIGRLSEHKGDQIPRDAIRARIVADEKIIDVTDLLLHAAGTRLLIEQPAETGVNSAAFLSCFCFGLAAGIGVGYDLKDTKLPPSNLDEIKEQLAFYDSLGIKICVFLTETRAKTELDQITAWFPLLEVAKTAEREAEELKGLHNKVGFFNKLLDSKHGRDGTTDIVS